MVDGDKERFRNLVDALASMHGVQPSPPFYQAYWLGLRDLEFADFERAVGRAIQASRFMPKPVELRELAGIVPASSRAIVAWEAVRRAMRDHGAYASIEFDDPITTAAVRTLGQWPDLCRKDRDEIDRFERAKFAKAYEALAEMPGLPPEHTAHLRGLIEADAAAMGRPAKPPVRVKTGLPVPPTPLAPGRALPPAKGEASPERKTLNGAQAGALTGDVLRSLADGARPRS